jgi:hypothetical protein
MSSLQYPPLELTVRWRTDRFLDLNPLNGNGFEKVFHWNAEDSLEIHKRDYAIITYKP